MENRKINKGNTLITYLFPDDSCACDNVDNEIIMQKELAQLMTSFVERGLIRRFIVAPDDVINERLTRSYKLDEIKAANQDKDETVEIKEV